MKILHTEDYAKLREAEYPPLVEFVDAQYWQSRGDNRPMEIYLSKCDQVKLKYPKPK